MYENTGNSASYGVKNTVRSYSGKYHWGCCCIWNMASLYETQVQPLYCEVSRGWKQHGYDAEWEVLRKSLKLDKVIQLEPHDQILLASNDHEKTTTHACSLCYNFAAAIGE